MHQLVNAGVALTFLPDRQLSVKAIRRLQFVGVEVAAAQEMGAWNSTHNTLKCDFNFVVTSDTITQPQGRHACPNLHIVKLPSRTLHSADANESISYMKRLVLDFMSKISHQC
jgi:hypothetical protein